MFDFIKKLFLKTHSEPDTMKYLVAGLGNIGSDYENTRHNVGFDVMDVLAKEFGVSFTFDNQAFVAEFKHKGRTFVLIKPTTYMNLSGKAVRYWLNKHTIPKENLLVVVDDLALPFGKQRLRPNGSNGGHNGLKHIDETLGDNNYVRLRIGIGNEFGKGKQVDYVLGRFFEEEVPVVKKAIELAVPDATRKNRS